MGDAQRAAARLVPAQFIVLKVGRMDHLDIAQVRARHAKQQASRAARRADRQRRRRGQRQRRPGGRAAVQQPQHLAGWNHALHGQLGMAVEQSVRTETIRSTAARNLSAAVGRDRPPQGVDAHRPLARLLVGDDQVGAAARSFRSDETRRHRPSKGGDAQQSRRGKTLARQPPRRPVRRPAARDRLPRETRPVQTRRHVRSIAKASAACAHSGPQTKKPRRSRRSETAGPEQRRGRHP